jgi:hypothetical protein
MFEGGLTLLRDFALFSVVMRSFERERDRSLREGDCITFEFLKGDTLLLFILRIRLDSVSESTTDFFLIAHFSFENWVS